MTASAWSKPSTERCPVPFAYATSGLAGSNCGRGRITSLAHQHRREGQAVQERAEEAIALSREQEFPFWLALGTFLRGWALTEQGQGEEGIAQMRQGLAAYQATGAEMIRPWCLALLVKAYGKEGQTEEGLSVLAEALAVVDKNDERVYEAELYRLKGELTLQSESRSPAVRITEAAACLHQALDIARHQQAKSLELRAATSLAHVWQRQGKKEDAHQLLSEIYNWFTEGFDTADLKDAKALLDELS